ncbi:hypothetical protein BH09GEM1_BH09GEM1_00360 [soil metagenome]
MRLAFLICPLLVACSTGSAEKRTPVADTGFAALQARGRAAMGVDQYTSSHVFEALPDGGRIVLQRDSIDSAGTVVIRAHLRDIAARFSGGDFSIPGMVHAQVVPGTVDMASRRNLIRYVADTLPRGGEVRISSSDATAIAAIHTFLAFQQMDHHAAGHEHR